MSRRQRPRVELLILVLALGCQPGAEHPPRASREPSDPASRVAPEVPSPPGPVLFRDATAESGLDFVHFNGMSGELYFSEMVGPGGALFDYDNDGDLDVFLVQGSMLGAGKTVADALFPPRHPLPLTDRLYRNDLQVAADGSRQLRFTDVTAESGLGPAAGYGMGVSTGDFDNDGRVDLYITRHGSNQLLRNLGPDTRGQIRFGDVTVAASAEDDGWSVPSAVFDYDRDGWLDLFVGNYVAFTVAANKRCRAATGAADYCGPLSYSPEPDRLLRNLGQPGRIAFENVTTQAGIDRHSGGALGATAADLDLDGWPDLYVANDGVANQMWINQGDGTFRNEALLAGSALNRDGHPEAGMGVDAADYDNDGDEDLFLAHLVQETNTLYRNTGRGHFDDATVTAGLGSPSWEYTSFGTAFFDYDNDGWLDLLVANGAVKIVEALARAQDPYPLHQPNQLFRNLGAGQFEEVTAAAGEAFEPSEVSRGAAFGDLDNDGDSDVLIVNNNGPVRLLLNQVGADRSWLGLRLVGREVERDMLGAWAEVVRSGGAPSLWRRVDTGGSYASASDPRLLFGLGDAPTIQEVRVRWPSGELERFVGVEAGRYQTLREGTGEPL